MTLVIEKNVPLRPGHHRNGLTDILNRMEVNDSVLIKDEDYEITAARNIISRYGKMRGKLFTVRRVDAGHRCWRLK